MYIKQFVMFWNFNWKLMKTTSLRKTSLYVDRLSYKDGALVQYDSVSHWVRRCWTWKLVEQQRPRWDKRSHSSFSSWCLLSSYSFPISCLTKTFSIYNNQTNCLMVMVIVSDLKISIHSLSGFWSSRKPAKWRSGLLEAARIPVRNTLWFPIFNLSWKEIWI